MKKIIAFVVAVSCYITSAFCIMCVVLCLQNLIEFGFGGFSLFTTTMLSLGAIVTFLVADCIVYQ